MRRWSMRTVARRAVAAGLAGGVAVGALVTLAAPAGATLAGGCKGEGTFAVGSKDSGKGPFVAEKIPASEVITIPLKDSVTWSGSVPVPAAQRDINGFVKVKLPWPFSGFTIDSWGGPSSKIENNGVKDYKLPSLMPRDTEFKVYGAHHDANGVNCAGFLLVKVEGSYFDSAVTYIALGATLILLILFWLTGKAKAGVV
jgi:hypothetical protein